MRYSAAEKLEIIRLVEQSSLPLRRTLAQIGIPRSTFYAWYERYLARGAGALEDGQPAPRRVWNKLPDTIAQAVIGLALKEPELSPRELATAFVDEGVGNFVFVSHTKKPVRAGGRYGGEQGRRNRG